MWIALSYFRDFNITDPCSYQVQTETGLLLDHVRAVFAMSRILR